MPFELYITDFKINNIVKNDGCTRTLKLCPCQNKVLQQCNYKVNEYKKIYKKS